MQTLGSFPDRRSAGAGAAASLPAPPSAGGVAPRNAGFVDRELYEDLVQIVPLVESLCLMDRRAGSAYSRRASAVYTAAPAQSRKVGNSRNGKTTKAGSARKRRDELDFDGSSNDISREPAADGIQKNNEAIRLQQEVNDLQTKLLEKDEALKTLHDYTERMNEDHVSFEELKHLLAEKDSFVKTVNLELYDAKIKLADKQASLEKLEWEARTSNRKLEELEGNLATRDFEVSSFMQLFDVLAKNTSSGYVGGDICFPEPIAHLSPIDNYDAVHMGKMEAARISYIAAVAAAKEDPCDELLDAARQARARLRSFVL